jgi:uncharacterized protein YkwD
MIQENQDFVVYTCWMYNTPYKLLAIKNVEISGSTVGIEEEEFEDEIIYKVPFANANSDETSQSNSVVVYCCPDDIYEIEVAVTNIVKATLTDNQAFTQALLKEINLARRAYAGITTPLNLDLSMSIVANMWAYESAVNKIFSHFDNEGNGPKERAEAYGLIMGESFTALGENVGYINRNIESNNDAKLLVKGWYDSVGHRINMLNPQWDRVGIGLAYSETNELFVAVTVYCYGGTGSVVDGFNTEGMNIYGSSTTRYAEELSYEVTTDNQYSLEGLNFRDSIDIKFQTKIPDICAIMDFDLMQNHGDVLLNTISFLNAGHLGVIPASKNDVAQLAGKTFNHNIYGVLSMSSHAPGTYYFTQSMIDNYSGEYPPNPLLDGSHVITSAVFLETFGLSGGRIINVSQDVNGRDVYTVSAGGRDINVYAVGNFKYSNGDYVIVGKTNNDLSAALGFILIGDGKDNSPHPASAKDKNVYLVTNATNRRVISPNDVNNDLFILPVNPLDLPI